MQKQAIMKIGVAADHGGYALKEIIKPFLQELGFEVKDYGAYEVDELDDYPDLIIPLAKGLQKGEVDRAIAFCGSGVGACVAANKVNGVRACLITDHFSAHQGVEDDDMNMLCLGGRITGNSLAKEIVEAFVTATFKTEEKYRRRLDKVKSLEKDQDH
jgi:ribose 5-phosphate isomerase B